jgi:hypothetical protein
MEPMQPPVPPQARGFGVQAVTCPGLNNTLSRKVKKHCSSRSLARGTMDMKLVEETIFCKYVCLGFVCGYPGRPF